MRIAQIAPIIESVPPKKYGGTERVVHALTEGLMAREHEVTLFASGDSSTSARLVSVSPRPIRELKVDDLYGPNQWTLLNIGLAYQRQKEFDIIHDHNSYLSLPTANISRTPTVLTIHGAITPANKHMFEVLNNPYLVSISHSQTFTMANLNFIGTVYNGIDMTGYPFSATDDGYMLSVGRFSYEKGVHHAIDLAIKLNRPLVIAAKVDDKDLPYFRRYIEPKLGHKLIKWVGEVDEAERNRLMSKALCFLHPVTWREPFGLTLIEAMANGCPVIGFNRGSIPEVIEDGKTGFVVNDLQEMAAAVKKISGIDRRYCRQYALQNFNDKRMARGYETIYQQVLADPTRKSVDSTTLYRKMIASIKENYYAAHDIRKKPRK